MTPFCPACGNSVIMDVPTIREALADAITWHKDCNMAVTAMIQFGDGEPVSINVEPEVL